MINISMNQIEKLYHDCNVEKKDNQKIKSTINIGKLNKNFDYYGISENNLISNKSKVKKISENDPNI